MLHRNEQFSLVFNIRCFQFAFNDFKFGSGQFVHCVQWCCLLLHLITNTSPFECYFIPFPHFKNVWCKLSNSRFVCINQDAPTCLNKETFVGNRLFLEIKAATFLLKSQCFSGEIRLISLECWHTDTVHCPANMPPSLVRQDQRNTFGTGLAAKSLPSLGFHSCLSVLGLLS